MRLLKLTSCPPELEGARLCVSWKWGSKECNRGTSETFSVSGGAALIVHNFQVVSSFVQQMPSKTTDSNRMVLALQVVKGGGARETLASRSIDMAQFSTDRSEKTKVRQKRRAKSPFHLILGVSGFCSGQGTRSGHVAAALCGDDLAVDRRQEGGGQRAAAGRRRARRVAAARLADGFSGSGAALARRKSGRHLARRGAPGNEGRTETKGEKDEFVFFLWCDFF